MIPADKLLDAFVNANILFVFAYVFWLLVRGRLGFLGLARAYGAQLRLLNSIFLTIVLAPLIALGFGLLQQTGVAPGVTLNLSDMVVAYYLNGGLQMRATEFETLVTLRNTVTLNIVSGVGWVAWLTIAILGAGFIAGTLRLAVSVTSLRRIVQGSYAWRRFGRVQLRLSDKTLVPFSTRGFYNYYVVIPSHMLAEAHELKVSLAHEFQHIRQGDLEWEILIEALKPIFFLNPVYHAWKRQVENLRELNCDSEVLSRGRIDLRDYCDTLLSVCQKTLSRDRDFVIAVPKVTLVSADRPMMGPGGKSVLEARIRSLTNLRDTKQSRLAVLALVLPFVAVVALLSLAIQTPPDWSQDRLMLSTVVNLERLDEINRLSTFGRN